MTQNLNNKTLVFLHIPKSAGSWFQNVIKDNIKTDLIEVGVSPGKVNYQEFSSMCSNERIYCKALTGHLQYGIGKYLAYPPYYVTFLRDPVERYLSQIADVKKKGYGTVQHLLRRDDIKQKDLLYIDPIKFLQSPISKHFGNLQTRYLCNMNIYRDVNYSDLKEAKLNLKHNIGIFGLTERLIELENILKQEFGWKNIKQEKINITNNKYHLQEEEISIIKSLNKYDIELYDYAKELLFQRYGI